MGPPLLNCHTDLAVGRCASVNVGAGVSGIAPEHRPLSGAGHCANCGRGRGQRREWVEVHVAGPDDHDCHGESDQPVPEHPAASQRGPSSPRTLLRLPPADRLSTSQ